MFHDPQFDAPEFNTPAVLNAASVLSTVCGRVGTEGFQACEHDHRGEAVAFVRSVVQTEGVELLDEAIDLFISDGVAAVQAKRDDLKASAEVVPAR